MPASMARIIMGSAGTFEPSPSIQFSAPEDEGRIVAWEFTISHFHAPIARRFPYVHIPPGVNSTDVDDRLQLASTKVTETEKVFGNCDLLEGWWP